MFFENVKIALRAIGANKMRSVLTVLGVMIGVAAVIAVVSLVQGMQFQVRLALVPDFATRKLLARGVPAR